MDLTATLDNKDAKYMIIVPPTNYDPASYHFNTSAVESIIDLVMKNNPNAMMINKSTIQDGYTASVRKNTTPKTYYFPQNS